MPLQIDSFLLIYIFNLGMAALRCYGVPQFAKIISCGDVAENVNVSPNPVRGNPPVKQM